MKNEELARILVERSYLHDGPFTLASGRTSDFYFDCRLTTTFAPAMPLIGRAFLERFQERPETVGGLTIREAADAISISIDTLRRWCRAGKMLSVRMPGGRIRIHRKVVEGLVDQASGKQTDALVQEADKRNKLGFTSENESL